LTAVEPTTPTNTPTTAPRSRRDVLCGLLVAIVAPGAVVAACSSSSDSSSDTSSGGTSTGGSTAAGSSSGLAALADVPDGGGVVVDNPNGGVLLIVKSGSDVKAYNAACTHMGTTVDAPVDGISTCPNHGSEFSITDGSVKKGPATKALGAVSVKVDGDNVVLA
jgi:nitrite reductase/ring-hydroxylating ferredoxin subunit